VNALRRGIKNAFRNTVRSVGVIVILAVAIALSISMLVARDAVTKKINDVRASTGNTITVSPKGFFGFQGGGTPLTDAQMSEIASVAHVTVVRASLNERLTSSETSLTSGITPGTLGQQFGGGGFGGATGTTTTFSIPITVTGTTDPGNALTGGASGGGTEKLTSGSSFSASSSGDVAIIGTTLASANKLTVGSTFTAWKTSIKVIGIYNAQSTFANNGVLMPLATVQKLAGAANQVTGATVVVDNVNNVASTAKAISAKLGSAADVTSQQQATLTALAPLNSVKTISTYTLFGAVGAAGIILLLSMLMIVRERRREVGVLKALGASNRSVIGQFIAESTTFTVLGSIVGLIVGILLSSPITSALVSASSNTTSGGGGFTRNGFGGGPGGGFGGGGFTRPTTSSGLRFGGFHSTITQVHAAVGWSTLLFAFIAAIVVAIVGSAVATATILRIRPAEVLRSE